MKGVTYPLSAQILRLGFSMHKTSHLSYNTPFLANYVKHDFNQNELSYQVHFLKLQVQTHKHGRPLDATST